MNSKFTSTVAGASIFIALISLLSRGLGFLREIIFAGYFGTGEEFDLYLVGAVLPLTIIAALTYITQNYFVPAYNNYSSINEMEAENFFKQKFLIFVFSGIAIGLLLFVTADLIIDLYLKNSPGEVKETALQVYHIFLLTLPFAAGTAITSAYLQAIFEFKYSSQSVLFLNISTILFVLILGRQVGVFTIAIGYLIGTILQFSYLLLKVKIKISPAYIRNFSSRITLSSLLSFSMISIIVIEIISQFYTLIDRYFYRDVSTGGIAALNYAQTLFLFPVSFLSMALGTVIFPKISAAVKEGKFDRVKSLFNDSVLVTLFLFTPITFIYIFYSDGIVKLFFERGSFTEYSTNLTSAALKYFALSLVFYGVYAVINKIFYSLGLTLILMLITITGILIKIAANFFLVEIMQHSGLALGTTISFFFFFISCFFILNHKLKLALRLKFVLDVMLFISNAFLTYMIVVILFSLLEIKFINDEILQIFCFFLIFTLNLFIIKHPSIKLFIDVFMRWKVVE